MRMDVFTLLPEVMETYLHTSILGRAQTAGLLDVKLHNIRDYTTDRHRTTDDEPFGGGGGMVMKPEPIFAAVETILGSGLGEVPVILLTPQGRLFSQKVAMELSQLPRLALICGRYEGVDERIRQYLATDELSIGDYVLTGGEIPALTVIDAVARLIPGVLGDSEAMNKDSHTKGLLEHPHYTRPSNFRGWEVPEVLLSGDHGRIDAWRHQQSLKRTIIRRPDLLREAHLSEHDQAIIAKMIEDKEVRLEDEEKKKEKVKSKKWKMENGK
ncbi:MAG: tRNA (guanosine(37)-N1)-methyltransferase TrmD [Chloroflexi bacterium RBG_16_48_8]|nr:MAG: tRNA (guanosine(37)-N1)-methyltransferase TrmD [Chloroflexi bacterium RBG_16_48_8]